MRTVFNLMKNEDYAKHIYQMEMQNLSSEEEIRKMLDFLEIPRDKQVVEIFKENATPTKEI